MPSHLRLGARPRALAIAALGVVLVISLAGCDTLGVGLARATDSVTRSLDVAAGTPVRVETFNGAIDVVSGPAGSLTARIDRTGQGDTYPEAEADLDNIEVTLELVDGTALLKAVYAPSPDSIRGSRGAAVTLTVPPDSPLDLSTSNGAVTVRDVARSIDVETSNGAVDLRGVQDDLTVDTSNGSVTIRSGDATIDVRTSNGAVDIETGVGVVDIQTSNGSVAFAGQLAAGENRFRTSSGRIDLRLPGESAFSVEAWTSNGEVTSEFAGARATDDETRLEGTIGGASDVSVEASTSNGDIVIAQG